MKAATKAALLSGLVFPGLGQLYLRRRLRGLLLVIGAGIATWFILSVAVSTALELSAEIQSGAVPADVTALTTLIDQRSAAAHAQARWPTFALLALWLGGIADAWYLGRRRDLADAAFDRREQASSGRPPA
ncbi:MAG: hypothetical protein H6977_00565 [Gammaproteobacteria bacterium]|nr:hypothetical protein [Gammaproteobacteria bacterium]MCP5198469.1 hypothetical protein [Gammaproteobacteria bacterium]